MMILLTALLQDVTYAKDVAPILFKHCASCHRPGEIGPFPLTTYKDAAKRAKHLVEATSDGRMPPWKAEPQAHAFKDERRMSADEKSVLRRWAESGAPEGENAPPAPSFPEGWRLGTPDLVLTMAKPFKIPAGGRDVHRCFVVPIPIDADKTVAAVEFKPGNPAVVHHALMFLDSLGQGRKKDVDGTGFGGFGGVGILPTGGLGGWVPGATPRFLPEGTGMYLRKGSDLVLQIHYHPTGKEEEDQSRLGLYFTKTPAEKIVTGIAVASRGLYIPAGAKRHKASAESQPLPVDANLIGIAPHMHTVGREMRVWAELPGGKTEPLIWIKDWDFNWQGSYQYERSVRLPKGTVVKLEAFYDNSTDNPQNPSSPPKPVRWGEQTTDEMCLLGLQMTTDTPEDLKALTQMRGSRLGAGLLGGTPGTPETPSGPIPIPEKWKSLLERWDTDKDGKLDDGEIDEMPAALKDRIRKR
ncbi:MAG TPA: ascorbate-dependent monooxygenase [Planctomycetota bacterium]